MTEPSDVLHLFEQADPVRGDDHPRPTVDAATYLAQIQHRPAADRPVDDRLLDGRATRFGPHRRLLFVAAVVMVVVGLGWLVVRLGSGNRLETGPVESSTTTTAPTTTTTTTTAESTTTLSPEEEAWEAITPWVASFGAAGEYRSTHFTPEIVFSVPEGWTRVPGASELPNGVTPMVRPGGAEPEGLFIYRHEEDASVDAWLERMQAHESVSILDVQPSTLGEVEAIEVRFEMVSSMIYIMLTDQLIHQLDEGEAGVVRVAEVDGEVVSVLVLAPDAAQLPVMEAESQPILDSVSWRSLRPDL